MDFLDWKSIGSLLATFMFLRTAIRDFLPPEVYHIVKHFFLKLFASFHLNMSIIIDEFDSSYNNEPYDSVQSYLSAKSFSSAKILRLSKPKNSKNLTFTMDTNQKVEDTFNGFKVKWSLHSVEKTSNNYGHGRSQEARSFELTFHRKYMEKVHSLYIPHIMEEAAMIKFKNRERKLYTNGSAQHKGRLWSPVPFSHPSTFDTVAIDPVLKEEIKADLIKFVNRREFYSRVGRAWKRGYLLYGPPGTGKTSLIAAIANFLEFDIYDLELTAVMSNSQLRELLHATSSKSVVVVEDVDCTMDLSDRKKRMVRKKERDVEENEDKKENENDGASTFSTVSLSGVLNFVDGLWSSCVGERLMIFTTNHKEKLDPALLRTGRMDKHINLSFCEFRAFKILMKNYLYIDEHELEKEVEEVLPLVKITPADIAEIFMSCNDDSDLGMRNLVQELKKRLISASAFEANNEIGNTETTAEDEKLKEELEK